MLISFQKVSGNGGEDVYTLPMWLKKDASDSGGCSPEKPRNPVPIQYTSTYLHYLSSTAMLPAVVHQGTMHTQCACPPSLPCMWDRTWQGHACPGIGIVCISRLSRWTRRELATHRSMVRLRGRFFLPLDGDGGDGYSIQTDQLGPSTRSCGSPRHLMSWNNLPTMYVCTQ